MGTKFKKGLMILGIAVCSILVLHILLIFIFFKIRLIYCNEYNADGGWYCNYDLPIYSDPLLKIYLNIACKFDKGRFGRVRTIPSRGIEYNCFKDYSDIGQTCKNSSECEGFCKYEGDIPSDCVRVSDDLWGSKKYVCSSNLEGICADGRENLYEEYMRVERGYLFVYTNIY